MLAVAGGLCFVEHKENVFEGASMSGAQLVFDEAVGSIGRNILPPAGSFARELVAGASIQRPIATEFSEDSKAGLAFARSMAQEAVTAWWSAMHASARERRPVVPPPAQTVFAPLSADAAARARGLGVDAAASENASYLIGSFYTGLMPKPAQARLGAYYTPPALCERLVDLATGEGIDWRTARVLDPACGGGAFLSPVARRMAESLKGSSPALVAKNIVRRLRGFELDPFAAWLSRVFLEATLAECCASAHVGAGDVIETCDSLEREPHGEGFDLVIGNPPYGRLTLPPHLRQKYNRSLYGHANLYGVFTDLALRLCRPGGVIAYVTPTSFLAGEYFKTLRGLLGRQAPPASIDFVAERKGVFTDVLQETVLAVYRKGARRGVGQVHFISSPAQDGAAGAESGASTLSAGVFQMPSEPDRPWFVPRARADNDLVQRAERMPHRLAHYGYQVSTGPLVWNRHKPRLREKPGHGTYPLIWAESVRPDGSFEFRARKKNHQPWFAPLPTESWVVTKSACVLLQRTTAKEQSRRLIAAELPPAFVKRHGAVVVENHLNMIRPVNGAAPVSPAALAALFNTQVVDRLFRCINGSVAVSAYELESLPLPPPQAMREIERLLKKRATRDAIERIARRLYGERFR
jgi:adenine-specific DNA-methyltransferase